MTNNALTQLSFTKVEKEDRGLREHRSESDQSKQSSRLQIRSKIAKKSEMELVFKKA